MSDMSRGARNQSAGPATVDDARDRILAAAERCIDRHGIRKTTMEDIASEAGMSRPGVYRYFTDRDDLMIELITRHSRAMAYGAQKYILRQASLSDQIVEGVAYIADHARQDAVTRYITEPEGARLLRRMSASRTLEMIAKEFWDPILDATYVNNQLPREMPRSDIYLWIRSLILMVVGGLEAGDGDLKRYRSILRCFVAPAFASPQQ
jgi:AcrR family transcriptional regulator